MIVEQTIDFNVDLGSVSAPRRCLFFVFVGIDISSGCAEMAAAITVVAIIAATAKGVISWVVEYWAGVGINV